MSRATSTAEYQALAQFRFLIRRYLNNSEKAARSVGLEPQQYMGMLALRGYLVMGAILLAVKAIQLA